MRRWLFASIWGCCSLIFLRMPRGCWYIRRKPIRWWNFDGAIVQGKLLGSLGAFGEYYTPRISPDGQRVAFTRRDGNNSDIWVTHLATNSLVRLTFDPGIDEYPVWSPDGTAVTFANDASGVANLYRKAAAGTGAIERLTNSRFRATPLDWSCDGRFL